MLASPFVGVSNDTLLLLRRNAVRRPLFTALERSFPRELDGDDERLLRAFLQRYERLVARQPALARTALRADPRRARLRPCRARALGRAAPLRKPAQARRGSLAPTRQLRGADLEGFVRFVHDQESFGARELEAVAGGGGRRRRAPAHDPRRQGARVQGRDRRRRGARHRRPADARRDPGALRRTLRLQDGAPDPGERRPVFDYEEVRDASARQERAERLRLYYVAMTRAIDRLIVSGAIDPERARDRETPIGWVIERLDAGDEIAGADASRSSSSVAARAGSSRSTASSPEAPAAAGSRAGGAEEGQLALFAELPAGAAPRAPSCRELEPVPAAAAHRPARLSYSAISLFDSCSYRYYAERVSAASTRGARQCGGGDGGLAATEIGDAAHRLLELVPLAAPGAARRSQRVRGWYPRVSDEELERIEGFVEAYCASGSRCGSQRSPASVPSARSRSSTTACFSTAGSTRSRATAARARRSTTRRTRSASARRRRRRRRLPAAASGVRAGVPEGRCRGGRGRLPVPRAAGRGLVAVHARRHGRAGSGALGRDRANPRGSSGRRRASSPARAARRSDLMCAGPRLGGGRPWAPAPELTAAGGNVAPCGSRLLLRHPWQPRRHSRGRARRSPAGWRRSCGLWR